MKNDKEYYNYIINYTEDNKAISYKNLKKEIIKENKKACKKNLKLIKSELRHERIYDLEIPTIMSASTALSPVAFYIGITEQNSDALLLGSGCVLIALANVGLYFLDSEKTERKEKIKKLKEQREQIKNFYKKETDERLTKEREFIDSKHPYVKKK